MGFQKIVPLMRGLGFGFDEPHSELVGLHDTGGTFPAPGYRGHMIKPGHRINELNHEP